MRGPEGIVFDLFALIGGITVSAFLFGGWSLLPVLFEMASAAPPSPVAAALLAFSPSRL